MLNNKSSPRYLTNISTPTTPPASAVAYSYPLSVAFGFIAALAFIGNGLFCILILKNYRMLRSAYNLLIFTLAVTDMITGVIIGVTPNYVVPLGSYQVPGGLPGVIFCKVICSSYFVFVFGKVSCLTVTCLTLERWYSVVKPVKYRLKFKRGRVCVYLVIIWITCLLLHSLMLFEMTLDEKKLRCVWITPDFPKQLTPMTITIVTFFFPNVVTWVTYLHISLALKTSPAIKNNGRLARARLKLLRMCVIVALLFTICWFPNQLYYVLSSYGLVRLESPSHRFTVVLAMFNSCINPVIYCSTHQEYRKGFLRLLCPFFNSCRCKKRRETSLAQENRLKVASGEFEMETFDGGVMLTFRNLVNQGYEVGDCKQEDTSGV
ncbi:unnamed protein product [Porites evermanni]|nr:unnamed protein product [Porites evermanni]